MEAKSPSSYITEYRIGWQPARCSCGFRRDTSFPLLIMFFKKRDKLLYSTQRGDMFVQVFKRKKWWHREQMILKVTRPFYECNAQDMFQMRELFREVASVER